MCASLIRFILMAMIAFTATGCASYTVPGPAARLETFGVVSPADREQLTDYGVRQVLELKPLATFPANLCVARVQGGDYRNYYCRSYGRGAYSVVTTRDVETDEHYQRLAGMPMVQGVAPMNRLLLPADLRSDRELRQAAARLHAQVLLVYTFDTQFYDENNASPLDVVTLGFGAHKKVRITSTASAALLDVRNGYVYGVAESTARHEQDTRSWNNEAKADESRRRAEAEAFDGLVDELAKTWSGVVRQYAGVYRTTAGE
jgi:hypothetical protein